MANLVREQASKLNVQQFKLMNGEDIVACVVEQDTSFITIEGPLQIIETTENGIYQLGFRPWLEMSSDTNAVIRKTGIIATAKLSIDNKESYLEAIISLANVQTDDPLIEDDIEIDTSTVH